MESKFYRIQEVKICRKNVQDGGTAQLLLLVRV